MNSFLYHETLFMTVTSVWSYSMDWKYICILFPWGSKELSLMISPLYTSLLVERKAEIKKSDLIACLNQFNQDCDNGIPTSDEMNCLWVVEFYLAIENTNM